MKVLLRCGDSDTGCGERERGPDTYECTHTNIASHGGRSGTGAQDSTHQHSDQNTGGLARPSGPVTRRARRKPGEADGGAGG